MGVVTRSQLREFKNQYKKDGANLQDVKIEKEKSIHVNTYNQKEEQEKYDCAVILCTLKNNIRRENFKKSIIELANQLADQLVNEI